MGNNPYKDEKGHWTTKENDGGPCKHKNGNNDAGYGFKGKDGIERVSNEENWEEENKEKKEDEFSIKSYENDLKEVGLRKEYNQMKEQWIEKHYRPESDAEYDEAEQYFKDLYGTEDEYIDKKLADKNKGQIEEYTDFRKNYSNHKKISEEEFKNKFNKYEKGKGGFEYYSSRNNKGYTLHDKDGTTIGYYDLNDNIFHFENKINDLEASEETPYKDQIATPADFASKKAIMPNGKEMSLFDFAHNIVNYVDNELAASIISDKFNVSENDALTYLKTAYNTEGSKEDYDKKLKESQKK